MQLLGVEYTKQYKVFMFGNPFLMEPIINTYFDGWKQSITQNQTATSCKDVVSASIPWNSISTCLKDDSDTNLYRGKVLIQTTFSNTGYYSNNLLKRVAEDTIFTSERIFSFNFDAQITANTSDSTSF